MFYIPIIIICIILFFITHTSFLETSERSLAFDQPPVKPNCNKACPKNLQPVCGSDGKTYGNSCLFTNTNCQAGGKLKSKPGNCVSGPTGGIPSLKATPVPVANSRCPPGQHWGILGSMCAPGKPCIWGCKPNPTPTIFNAPPEYTIVQDCPEGQHKDIVAPRCDRDKPCPDNATPKLGCIPNKQLTIIPSVGCKSGYTKRCPKGDEIWYNQTVLKKTNPSECTCTNGKDSHPFPYE